MYNNKDISNYMLLLMLAIFIWLFWSVWYGLIGDWYQKEEYSHGFLIVPLAIYIGYTKSDKLSNTVIKSVPWGLFVVLFALASLLVGQLAEIITLARLSIIMLIAGAILYIYGYGWLKELSFALFILLFMIPIPSQIYSQTTIPLQLLVTKISVAVGNLMSIPILREGNVIHLPNHTLQVVQACSGLRSMVSLMALTAILGYIAISSKLLRGILIISSVPVAIIVNIARVTIMILAFYYFETDLAHGTNHTIFGVFIFLLALSILFALGRILSKWDNHTVKK